MDFSKLKDRLLIILCVFVVLFPFWCIRGLCSEPEVIEYDIVPNLRINSNSNVFTYEANQNIFSVGYVTVDENYIYTITNNTSSFTLLGIASSNEVPTLNGTYTFLYDLPIGESYTFRGNGNLYLCFRSNSSTTSLPLLTRQKVEGQASAVNDLVENVGINSIWNIFDISVNYILIVVLVAFGIFIISLVIRKISKGKEGF